MKTQDIPQDFEILGRFVDEIHTRGLLTPEEEKAIVARAAAGSEKDRKILIEHNLGFVLRQARRTSLRFKRKDLMLDLIQEGVFGLYRAIEKFDPSRGLRFLTYAGNWVHQSMERYILNCGRSIRAPIHSQIAKHQGDKVDVLEDAVLIPQETMLNLADQGQLDSQHSCDPSQSILDKETKETVHKVLRRLSKHRGEIAVSILHMRFGIGDRDPMALRAIGSLFGLKGESIRKRQKDLLSYLRDPRAFPELQGLVEEPRIKVKKRYEPAGQRPNAGRPRKVKVTQPTEEVQ